MWAYPKDNPFFQTCSSSGKYIAWLDGLRGVAVLFVILSHSSNKGMHLNASLNFSGSGVYGVYLFFVLSSFLLTLQLADRTRSEFLCISTWARYFSRRFLRIYPLYFFVLVLCYFVHEMTRWALVAPMPFSDLIGHLVLSRGEYIFWIIPVEFKFYFVLPVFCFVFVFLVNRNVLGALILVAGFTGLVDQFFWPPETTELNKICLGPYLPIFLMGSLVAVMWLETYSWGQKTSKMLRNCLEGGAFIAFMLIIVLIPSFYGKITGQAIKTYEFHHRFITFGLLWSIFLFCCLNGRGVITRVLATYPLRFVGMVSFSAYLWHIPVISVVRWLGGMQGPFQVLLVIVLTLAVSSLSYLLIEKPFRTLGLPGCRKTTNNSSVDTVRTFSG